ncbi:MAG: multi-sensor hybrid histidine kinase [Caulobacteraceae bacterium]|nr:MAG: multi-sensor hybrid histidine kinase [Caulobacteraceae bacterium]
MRADMPMPWILSLVATGYALLLFYLAWRVEGTPRGQHWVDRSLAYALSLAVYCTSWTFFGAVGTAATAGWTYLPIYLGPAVLFLFGRDFLRRLAEAVRRENLTSIADYISSRYGKSRGLAALVTVIATLAALPYIALQLKSLGMSSAAVLTADVISPPTPSHTVVAFMAAVLAVFAIIFGARRYEATGSNRGLIAALAVEGVVKLAALTLLGGYAIVLLVNAEPGARAAGLDQYGALFSIGALRPDFFTVMLLSMCAIVCLPRQFYVGFVEYRGPGDLRTSHWAFPVYLLVTALVVIPITVAGLALLPSGATPDLYVLDLPLAHGADWLAVLAFVGGFSAATGMVVAECVALSTMISNDLVAPFLLRRAAITPDGDFGARMLLTRRIAIVAILVLAFGAYLAIDRSETLASIGLVAFAAVAQFAPAVIGSLYWTKGSQSGVRWGLLAGGAVWTYTLFLPTLLGVPALEAAGLTGMLGGLLHPQALLGLRGLDPLTHGVVWSVGLNTLVFVIGSRAAPAAIADRLRAAVFTPGVAVGGAGGARTVGDLLALVERFVGAEEAQRAFSSQLSAYVANAPVTRESALLAERLVAQVIGAPSARVIVGSALTRGSLDVADVVSLIDETKQRLQFSRELLASTLDNISQGVSVVDQDLRLIAWNERYLDLFEFPPGFIQIGRPIAEVIRFNALRGECGPGEVDAHVERRLAAMRRRAPHTYERLRPNGATLKSTGNPMPGGGYVTSFTDITAEKNAQEALRTANEQLEARVAERTAKLSALNKELAAAKTAAEQATLGKTKFLAAASHDLLQPLNAARLFSAALDDALQSHTPATQGLARSIDRSIAAADSLLRALLDISKLDAGGVVADDTTFPIDPLLQDLTAQFAPQAASRGLKLRCVESGAWIRTDRNLLRSALQNFLANAVRYTVRGGVLVGCRVRGDRVVIEVWDTGPGIPEAHRQAIFEEFRRFHQGGQESAAGLGLAIVDRIARILHARVDLRSQTGKGSVFSIDAPRAPPGVAAETAPAPVARALPLRVLCVDNEAEILAGLRALLNGWGAAPVCASSAADAVAAMGRGTFDAALVDFHLGEDRDGLDVIDAWLARYSGSPFALITASTSPQLEADVAARGGIVLHKPVAPDDLRRFLGDALIVAQIGVS